MAVKVVIVKYTFSTTIVRESPLILIPLKFSLPKRSLTILSTDSIILHNTKKEMTSQDQMYLTKRVLFCVNTHLEELLSRTSSDHEVMSPTMFIAFSKDYMGKKA